MKKMRKHLINSVTFAVAAIATFGVALFTPELAHAVPATTTAANNFGTMFTNLATALGPAATFITGASYVAGVGFGVAALIGFKNHSENPQQIPMKQPMVKAVVAVCLVYFGYFLSSAAGTLFGVGASTTGTAGF